MFLYGYDAFVKFRGWRAGQLAQGERKVTQQTATGSNWGSDFGRVLWREHLNVLPKHTILILFSLKKPVFYADLVLIAFQFFHTRSYSAVFLTALLW
jgi:hypothetical protein